VLGILKVTSDRHEALSDLSATAWLLVRFSIDKIIVYIAMVATKLEFILIKNKISH